MHILHFIDCCSTLLPLPMYQLYKWFDPSLSRFLVKCPITITMLPSMAMPKSTFDCRAWDVVASRFLYFNVFFTFNGHSVYQKLADCCITLLLPTYVLIVQMALILTLRISSQVLYHHATLLAHVKIHFYLPHIPLLTKLKLVLPCFGAALFGWMTQ